MSWSPDLYIGELRPWPDSVHVVRGNTDETRRYFPERKDGQEALERRIDELCQEVERLRERLKASDDGRMRQADNLIDKCHKIACLQGENAKLRDEVERLRSVVSDGADNAREVLAENAALREQVDYMTPIALYAASEQERDRMHELGVVK